ncbi:MAG TPA: amino acid adenylation domain-containing protein [Actinophytocola sp.]|jgi:amino acid adenylation domain-containing protein/non-ribosomal peptide synthase protein (TIGR01720 family)|nr:amino acid adenylation domain-containing protein [Actinophytocola sp.]
MSELASESSAPGAFRLTGAQAGVWYAQQVEPHGTAFNIAAYLDIRGPVDLARLTRAIATAVADAECLHVRFDATPRQYVVPPGEISVPLLDFRAEPDPDGAAMAWALGERARRVDLTRGPLFAHALLRLADDRVWWYQRYHHIVVDGVGIALLVRRAADLYGAAGPSEVDWPLGGLAAAEEAYRASGRFGTDRAFWHGRLADAPEPARLLEPAAEPPARLVRHRSTPDGARLRAGAERSGVRPSRLLVAAVAAYTLRVTGAPEVVLGLPVTGRAGAAQRSVPGMVSNVLPLRVARRDTLGELVAAVAGEVWDVVAHSRFRAEELARELGVADGVAGLAGPTVNVIGYAPDLRFGAATATLHDVWPGPVSDLTVTVIEQPDGEFALDLDADAAVCGPGELAAHEAGLLAMLDAIATAPDARLTDVALVPDEARVLALGSAPRETEDVTWPGLVERQARRTPDAVALVCEDESLTYAELNAAANRLARSLVARGVRPEDVVGVALPRSTSLVVALLAVMKAGAAYLPLDTGHPAERLSFLATDAGARLVLTPADLDADAFDPSDVDIEVPLGAAAYVIYTSGSTGRPKGVVVTHDGMGSLVATAVDRLGVSASSRVAQFASAGFDVAVWDLCMALGTGARVVLVPEARRVAGPELTGYLAAHGVTHMILPPSLVAALPPDCRLPEGGLLVVGTEAVPAELVARWSSTMRVVVAYGLTEATVNSTLWQAEPGRAGPVPIGGPDPNTRLYVLDTALRPVGVGIAGELYVGGRGLARGYAGQPGPSATRFVADPFAGPGARMYRTGDRVRWGEDGNLEFLGRSDGQVKIRGHRVEPGEVESALLRHPGVRQAAVVARPDLRGGLRLVAYVAGEPAGLREHVAAHLPDYLVPSAVVAVADRLPLTRNGKLDVGALPEPDWAGLAGDAAPGTDAERALAEAFAAVLGLPSVGVHDSFFTLGGDSIVAIQLVSRARAAGLGITPRDVFRQRTVAALAAVATRLDSARPHDDGVGTVPVTPIVGWLRDLGTPVDGFHQSLLLPLPVAGIGAAELAAALQRLVDHHAVLRARLTPEWTLEVPPPGPVDILDGVGAGADVALQRQLAAAWLAPAEGRMLRAVWFPGEGRLLLVAHHLVVDGVSWRIIAGDLAALLAGGDPAPVGTSVRTWATGLAAVDRSGEIPFWRDQLAGPVRPLGTRRVTAADTAATARARTVTLPPEVTAPLLTTVPAAFHGSVTDVLLTALALAVTRWRGGDEVLVELEGHGREEQLVPGADLSRTVGWFTTTYPVRLRPGAGGPAASVKRVKEQLRAVPDHGIGYGLVRDRVPGAPPELLFNYLGRFDGEMLGGGPDQSMPLGRALTIDALVRDGALAATLTWPDGVLDDVDGFAARWTGALTELSRVDGGGHTPSDFPLVALDQARVDELGPGVADVLPASPLQEGFYFHAQGDDVYVVQQTVELRGVVDTSLLHRAAQAVLDRHAPLRASFRQLPDGRLLQVVADGVAVPWREATGDPAAVAADERAAGFDLARPPMLRAALVRDGDRSWVVLTLHHIATDGWSAPLLVRELLACYGPAGLAPVPPYRRYHEWLATRDHDASRTAWRAALSGVDSPTRLPGTRPGSTPRPESLTVSVPADRLTAVARARDLTLNTVVQGAWGLLLGRLTGREDVVFGTTVSGRSSDVDGIGSMIGLFANTLPVRMRWRASQPAAEALAELQAGQSELTGHHHVGLAELQRLAGLPELFDTLLVFENYPLDTTITDPSSTVSVGDVSAYGTGHYPLALIVLPGEELTIHLEYDAARVSRESVAHIGEGLTHLLGELAKDPARPVAHLALTGAGPLTGPKLPVPACTVTDLFDAQAARTPDAVAVVGDEALTYRELAAWSAAVADRVRGGVVAVEIPRSPELVVALLGVLRAGAVYVPVDPGHPAERRDFLRADSGATTVLTAADVRAARDEATPRPCPAGPGDAAYLIYTSGSTGQPKGVAVPHRALVSQLTWLRGEFSLGPDDRVLHHISAGFDPSLLEILWPLTTGAAVVLAGPAGHRDPAELAATCRRHGVTTLLTVASLLPALHDAGLGGLRVFSGGDALPAAVADRWAGPLYNVYGPTETTVQVTCWQHDGTTPVPIGHAVANTRLYVLDHYLRPADEGELYVAGAQLALGYHQRPALTAGRFIADPFGAPGERMYRTGDLVRRREDGSLVHLGRADQQVKVRGNRVELGEIEACLAAHPDVTAAAATVHGTRLVGYVTPSTVDTKTLPVDGLPVPPDVLVALDELPRTSGGKVDRDKLPEPAAQRQTAAPRNDRERALCEIFADVLDLDRVGADEDFFALGGDSILSITVSGRARAQGVDVSPQDVFAHRTPAALAALAAPAPPAAADPDGIGDVPLLPVVHHLRERGGPIDRFTLSMLVRTPAGATLERLTVALQAVLDRHDGLRLKLTTVGPLWSLQTEPHRTAEVHRVDVRDQNLRAAISRESATTKLAPQDGVMLRFVWFDAGETPGRLLIVAHHLVVDGVSWRVLFTDLAAAWHGRVLDPVPTSLRRFTRAVAEQATTANRLAELPHWTGTLAPGADLVPGARPGTVADLHTHTAELSTTDTEALLRGDVTATVLAALRTTVTGWRGDADLLVDVERHGREGEDDLSRTVGWLTSVQPVRLPASATTPDAVGELLRAAPDRGLGYGMLRHLNAQAAPLLARLPPAQVLVNYFGRFPAARDEDWAPAPEADALDPLPDPDLGMPHVLALDTMCAQTPDGPRLRATWTWTGLDDKDVRAVADGWLTTIRELAGARDRVLDRVRTVAGQPVEDVWPLSPLQEGLFFHAGYDTAGPDVYTAQSAMDFAGRLDVDALRKACATLLARNPSLRAGFTGDGLPGPVQFVAEAPELPIEVADLTGVPDARERAQQLMDADRTVRFDLARPPLCRMLVIRFGDGADRLVTSHHLILWDGWSQGRFLGQLLALYERAGDDRDLPAPGAYRDYLTWLSTQDTQAAGAAWRDALAGLAEPTLVGRAELAMRPVIPRRHLTTVDPAPLTATARAAGVTLNALLNAAWALVLASTTGRGDVVFGTTVAGRPTEVPNVDSAIGLFLNTVPVRVTLDPHETVAALLTRIQDQRTALMPHEYLGLGELQHAAGHAPLFDTLFVLQNFVDADGFAALGERYGITDASGVDATHYPLTLVVTPGEPLRVKLEYRPDVVDDAMAGTYLARFTTVLTRLAADPGALTGRLDLLLPGEETAPDGDRHPVPDETVADLLAAQALRTPGETALVFGDATLTYAELDARIDRLARLLLARGAAPEAVVALALPRSTEMVVALFAVLRTGAAYLPLDLDHPVDRLRLMIADTAPVCLLSTSTVDPALSADAVRLDDPAVLAELASLPAGPLTGRTFSLDHRRT